VVVAVAVAVAAAVVVVVVVVVVVLVVVVVVVVDVMIKSNLVHKNVTIVTSRTMSNIKSNTKRLSEIRYPIH